MAIIKQAATHHGQRKVHVWAKLESRKVAKRALTKSVLPILSHGPPPRAQIKKKPPRFLSSEQGGLSRRRGREWFWLPEPGEAVAEPRHIQRVSRDLFVISKPEGNLQNEETEAGRF